MNTQPPGNIIPQDARARIITAMRPGREYTIGDIARAASITEAQAHSNIWKLVDMGLVRRTGRVHGINFYAIETP